MSRKLFDEKHPAWLALLNVIEVLPPHPEAISKACHLLQSGECIGMPTETVYGLAADGLNPEACARIFHTKQRPSFDPLILHVALAFDWESICFPNPLAQMLAKHFWPGPLTLVLPKKAIVPDIVTSGFDTVAIRCPNHPVAQELLSQFQKPLAAPSANRFGRISPTDPQAVVDELGDSIKLVLDGGPCSIGIESTIVDCTGDSPKILRKGGITHEQIKEVVGSIDDSKPAKPVAPGMLENHYAPLTPLFLSHAPLADIPVLPQEYGYLFWSQLSQHPPKAFCQLSAHNSSFEAAVNLFRSIRDLDQAGIKAIIVDPIPMRDLGPAILDRLTKASRGEASYLNGDFKLTYLK